MLVRFGMFLMWKCFKTTNVIVTSITRQPVGLIQNRQYVSNLNILNIVLKYFYDQNLYRNHCFVIQSNDLHYCTNYYTNGLLSVFQGDNNCRFLNILKVINAIYYVSKVLLIVVMFLTKFILLTQDHHPSQPTLKLSKNCLLCTGRPKSITLV